MTEIFLLLVLLAVLIKPLGTYIAQVYKNEPTFIDPVCRPIEQLIYKLIGGMDAKEMPWRQYAAAAIWITFISFAGLYFILVFQGALPLNPLRFTGVSPDLAFNIAISMATSTNWQSYSGEQALSNFSQTIGIITSQFIAPASDMAVAAALFRSFTRKQTNSIGNFWRDMVRGIVYILLPLSLLFSFIYVTQGVVQGLDVVEYNSADGYSQRIMTGPVAAQAAIKQLGTNGGSYYGVNSAHPFENPTPLSNFISLLAILLLPAAFTYTFGIMAGDRRQGLMALATMTILATLFCSVAIYQEHLVPPGIAALNLDLSQGNMEGKEVRVGTTVSALWAILTTSTANGSAVGAHASMMPLSILSMLVPMKLGAVVFGGVGTGMLNLLMMIIVTVFMAGLMVGRTPEFLGKKLGPFEMKIAMLIFIIPAISVLIGTSLAVMTPMGQSSLSPFGSQGYQEALYAFTSAANNNGSALAGINANTPFYNALIAIAMFTGNCFIQVASIAIAGSLAMKNITPPTSSTLHTHTPLFISMLLIVLIISVLAYSPALVLGPIVDHFQMVEGVAHGN